MIKNTGLYSIPLNTLAARRVSPEETPFLRNGRLTQEQHTPFHAKESVNDAKQGEVNRLEITRVSNNISTVQVEQLLAKLQADYLKLSS